MRTGPAFRALQIWLRNRSRVADDMEFDEQAQDSVRADTIARIDQEETHYHLSAQFRRDVIEDLIAEGCTREQAEGRTRDQARLFHEAARLGVM